VESYALTDEHNAEFPRLPDSTDPDNGSFLPSLIQVSIKGTLTCQSCKELPSSELRGGMAPIDDAFTQQKRVFRNSWKSFPNQTTTHTQESQSQHLDPHEYHFVFSQNARTSPKARRHVLDQVNRRRESKKQHALRPTSRLGQLQWQKKSQEPEKLAASDDFSDRDSIMTLPSILQSPLGAGRVDPFSSLPAESGGLENELIDHCKHTKSFVR
jgi:hypothetical protein